MAALRSIRPLSGAVGGDVAAVRAAVSAEAPAVVADVDVDVATAIGVAVPEAPGAAGAHHRGEAHRSDHGQSLDRSGVGGLVVQVPVVAVVSADLRVAP